MSKPNKAVRSSASQSLTKTINDFITKNPKYEEPFQKVAEVLRGELLPDAAAHALFGFSAGLLKGAGHTQKFAESTAVSIIKKGYAIKPTALPHLKLVPPLPIKTSARRGVEATDEQWRAAEKVQAALLGLPPADRSEYLFGITIGMRLVDGISKEQIIADVNRLVRNMRPHTKNRLKNVMKKNAPKASKKSKAKVTLRSHSVQSTTPIKTRSGDRRDPSYDFKGKVPNYQKKKKGER